jgi:ABC-type phosphate transport system substrate-binding protein
MKHIIKAAALLTLVAGTAQAQTQHLRGSDTMAFITRDIIRTLGLGSGNDPLVTPCPGTDALCYDGGGSGLGYLASCDGRNTGQGVNPGSRPVNAGDQTCAHSHDLDFVVPQCEIARDGIAIVVNTVANGSLQQINLTDIGNIFSCAVNAAGQQVAAYWDQIPGSPEGHNLINKYTRDGVSGTTDVFAGRTHGLVDGVVTNFPGVGSPPDLFYWSDNFPGCVNTIYGDGATQVIGYLVANDPDGIGYAGLPVIQDGNYPLGVCDNVHLACSQPTDYIVPSITTIENGTYYYARPLFFANVQGFNGVDYTLPPNQFTLLDAACNPSTSCTFLAPIVARNQFFPAQRCFTP